MVIDQQFLMLAGLAVVAVVAVFYALSYNSLAQQKKASQRMKNLRVDPKTKVRAQAKKMDEKQRRKMREESLKTLDAKKSQNEKAEKPGLQQRMTQAGVTISLRQFHTYSIMFGVVTTVILFLLLRTPLHYAVGIGIVFGFGLPRWVISFLRGRRFKKFTAAFPGAIDVIVRGIRSGLPLHDCLRIIASDADEPVRSEFKKLVEATQVGLTVPEAAQRLYENVPTSETNFFAIVISIQNAAGGNLSEALANLSNVLRERRKMADKIKAFANEAKSSGMIIGSLPFVVAGAIQVTSPGYLNPLFTTSGGNKTLLVSATLMGVGIFATKKIMSFKF